MVGKRDDDMKDVYTVINGEKEIKDLGTTRLVEAEKKIKLKRDAESRWARRSSGRDRRPV